MNNEQKNSFYYDGYSDSKAGARYNPPEQPEFATQYRDGYEDYVFETNQFKRMTEYQLQNYITTKQAQQEFDAEYENATRIYNARFKPE